MEPHELIDFLLSLTPARRYGMGAILVPYLMSMPPARRHVLATVLAPYLPPVDEESLARRLREVSEASRSSPPRPAGKGMAVEAVADLLHEVLKDVPDQHRQRVLALLEKDYPLVYARMLDRLYRVGIVPTMMQGPLTEELATVLGAPDEETRRKVLLYEFTQGPAVAADFPRLDEEARGGIAEAMALFPHNPVMVLADGFDLVDWDQYRARLRGPDEGAEEVARGPSVPETPIPPAVSLVGRKVTLVDEAFRSLLDDWGPDTATRWLTSPEGLVQAHLEDDRLLVQLPGVGAMDGLISIARDDVRLVDEAPPPDASPVGRVVTLTDKAYRSLLDDWDRDTAFAWLFFTGVRPGRPISPEGLVQGEMEDGRLVVRLPGEGDTDCLTLIARDEIRPVDETSVPVVQARETVAAETPSTAGGRKVLVSEEVFLAEQDRWDRSVEADPGLYRSGGRPTSPEGTIDYEVPGGTMLCIRLPGTQGMPYLFMAAPGAVQVL